MSSTLNLSLTDELRTFVDNQVGDGTGYATPSEYLRALLREKKERLEAAELREAVLEGLQDVRAGRHVPFSGNLDEAIQAARSLRER